MGGSAGSARTSLRRGASPSTLAVPDSAARVATGAARASGQQRSERTQQPLGPPPPNLNAEDNQSAPIAMCEFWVKFVVFLVSPCLARSATLKAAPAVMPLYCLCHGGESPVAETVNSLGSSTLPAAGGGSPSGTSGAACPDRSCQDRSSNPTP